MDPVHQLLNAVRDVPDFPKPGILFKDITPILRDAALFRLAVDLFVERLRPREIAAIAAIEARGFIFGGAIADRLGIGFIPIRKQGKLPSRSLSRSYDLEYGQATLEVHDDALRGGDRVVVFDDLLATGGTVAATVSLLEELGARVVEVDVLIELAFLHGRDRLAGRDLFAPLIF